MRALGYYPSEQDVRHTHTHTHTHTQQQSHKIALCVCTCSLQIDDILNEIKFSEYVETGAYVTEIDLPTFIKCTSHIVHTYTLIHEPHTHTHTHTHTRACTVYINHRPAFGLSPVDLLQAFSSLSVDGEGPGCTVDRATLLAMLQENGTVYIHA